MLKYLFIISALFLGCGGAQLETEQVADSATVDDRSWLTWSECGYKVESNACNFKLINQNNEEVELYDYYGKVIVIDFSTMWCGVCMNIADEGDHLVQKFGSKNVVWLTVLIETEYALPPTLEDIQRWAGTYNINSPVLAGNRNFIDISAQTGYPITSWPTLVVIDKEMVIKHGINGWNSSAIDAWVSGLL